MDTNRQSPEMTYGLVVDRRGTFVSGDPGFDSWLDGRSSLISYSGLDFLVSFEPVTVGNVTSSMSL